MQSLQRQHHPSSANGCTWRAGEQLMEHRDPEQWISTTSNNRRPPLRPGASRTEKGSTGGSVTRDSGRGPTSHASVPATFRLGVQWPDRETR